MPFISAGGLVTHYDLSGPQDAPVLLLANSLGTSSQSGMPSCPRSRRGSRAAL